MISEAKLRQVIPGLEGQSPTVVLDLEARAVAFVERQTGRSFDLPTLTTEYIRGDGSHHLRLSEAVRDDWDGDVVVLERSTPGAASTTVEGFDLRNSDKTTYLARTDGNAWRHGYEYAVTYQMGYTVDSGPKDIESVVVGLVKVAIAFGDKAGMRSETYGGYSYTRFGDDSLDAVEGAKETIAAWRRKVFA